MPSSPRSGSLVLVAAAAVLAAACASSPAEPQGCQTAAQCPATARCVSGACVTNQPPGAAIALPSGLVEATRLLVFDGSGSRDADPDDGISSHAWTFRAVSAACDPPAVAGTGPTATVRFACAGRFAVDLAVADRLGAQASATKEFDVGDYTGPALLALGPDVIVAHRCASGTCTTTDAVTLSATPTSAAPAGLALAWSVQPPPGLSLDAHRRVTFVSGSGAPSTNVTIETDGQAISGDWVFHVEARDAVGVVASGAIRVSIANSRPVLSRTLYDPGHRFAGGQFTSTGEVAFTVVDPDGDDLLAPSVEWHHVGDGPGGTFTGAVLDSPRRVSFAITVPYTAPADALYLIGGPGLERTIRFSVSDVNGGTVSDVWPIQVRNTPPVLSSEPLGLTVNHTFDAAASAYVATVPLSSWYDADGDPLEQVGATSDAVCASFDVVAGVATARCSVPFQGTPAVGGLVGAHTVTQQVRDPWEVAQGVSTVAFTILNRAPALVTSPVLLHTTCTSGACCREQRDPETRQLICVAWDASWEPSSMLVAGRWVDDDGDPLAVTLTGTADTVCTPGACNLPFNFNGASVCDGGATAPPQRTLLTSAADGLASVSGSIVMDVTCP